MITRLVRGKLQFVLLFAVVAWANSAAAINIRIDYSTDTSGFFGDHNPQGAAGAEQAKAALKAAAQFYSGILGDEFSTISAPKFYGSLGGEASFFWKRRFVDPATGLNNARVNEEFDADEYVVYVGARDLPDAITLGVGGPGGFDHIFSHSVGQFTAAERTQVDAMLDELSDAISDRGQTTGFARWGGTLAFDSLKPWHFDHTTDPTDGTSDFFSVALHELAHSLGFGTSDQWNDLVNGTTFTGANAVVAYVPAGNVPLESADDTAHWDSDIDDSTIYGSGVAQEPLMTPGLLLNMRHVLTNLDAAALVDLGWEIELPGGAASAASFVTTSGSAGSAVVASLRASVVPEPSAIMLVLIVSAAGILVGPRRKRSLNCSGSCVARL